MTKLAMDLCLKEIRKNDYPVKMTMVVHDQIDFTVREDFAEEWANILQTQMEKAAEVILNNRLLKAEPTITDVWTK